MTHCSYTPTGPKAHDGPHLLMWFHTDANGVPYWKHAEAVMIHAYDPDEDIAAAVEVVLLCVERARAQHQADLAAHRYGFAVTADERAAIILAVEDACDYMICNRYAEDEAFPEDADLARLLGDGSMLFECFAAIPGWFEAHGDFSQHVRVGS